MQPIIKKNTTASSKKQITLQGTPACPGIATGPAHIVCGVADLTDFDQIKPGKILVFRNMNTAWVPYHPLIAGIIAFNGCPDTDNDGIQDSADDCPEAPGLLELNGHFIRLCRFQPSMVLCFIIEIAKKTLNICEQHTIELVN